MNALDALAPITAPTFVWHDYETFGIHPGLSRPAQWAAIRTNLDLDILDRQMHHCQPTPDVWPSVGACLVHGITPQAALESGLPEPAFAAWVHATLSQPSTCAVGYNSLAFDDEFTRFLLYRNFYPPYGHEYEQGNARFDLIKALHLAHALRPDGLHWPKREDGATSFKLTDLTAANGLAHERAHDALSDVEATIGLARLLKAAQPRLWDYALSMRDKQKVLKLLDVANHPVLVHTSQKIGSQRGNIGLFTPLAQHPKNPKEILCVDVMQDPTPWLHLEAEGLRAAIFSPKQEGVESQPRLRLKGIAINRVPMLAGLNVLTPETCQRWSLCPDTAQRHRDAWVKVRVNIAAKLQQVFSVDYPAHADPEAALYAGFLSRKDERTRAEVLKTPPEALADLQFDDERYQALLFRYRARHFPHTLKADEQAQWRAWRAQKDRPVYVEEIQQSCGQRPDVAAALLAWCGASPT